MSPISTLISPAWACLKYCHVSHQNITSNVSTLLLDLNIRTNTLKALEERIEYAVKVAQWVGTWRQTWWLESNPHILHIRKEPTPKNCSLASIWYSGMCCPAHVHMHTCTQIKKKNSISGEQEPWLLLLRLRQNITVSKNAWCFMMMYSAAGHMFKEISLVIHLYK